MREALPYVLIFLALFSLLVMLVVKETNKINIKSYVIKNNSISKECDKFEGIKIVFFSDLHIGRLMKKNTLKERIKLLKELDGDIYIFGGDLIGIDTSKYYSIQDVKDCFSLLKDKTTIAVYGNHEFKKVRLNDDMKIQYFEAMGFKTLIDEEFIFKKDDKELSIYGLQECLYHPTKKVTKKYDLIISHQGDVVDEICNQIILSGHTHGGQIKIPFIPIYYRPKKGEKYTEGVHYVNNSKLILSNGLGYGGLKIRLHSPCDIVLIDYRK